MPEQFNDDYPSPLLTLGTGLVIGTAVGMAVGLFLGVLFVGRVG